MPVFVASLTASSSLSYFGLKVTVKAQSMIRPERQTICLLQRDRVTFNSADMCQIYGPTKILGSGAALHSDAIRLNSAMQGSYCSV